MKAYRVAWGRCPDVEGIVRAASAGKARGVLYNSLRDVYDSRDVKWADLRAKRAPEFDHLVWGEHPRVASSEFIAALVKKENRSAGASR